MMMHLAPRGSFGAAGKLPVGAVAGLGARRGSDRSGGAIEDRGLPVEHHLRPPLVGCRWFSPVWCGGLGAGCELEVGLLEGTDDEADLADVLGAAVAAGAVLLELVF